MLVCLFVCWCVYDCFVLTGLLVVRRANPLYSSVKQGCLQSTRLTRETHIMQVLRKLPHARAVLVTAGGAGAAFCIRAAGELEKSGSIPVYDVTVQDTTGAGDAFTCGFLAYLLLQVCTAVDPRPRFFVNQQTAVIAPALVVPSQPKKHTKSAGFWKADSGTTWRFRRNCKCCKICCCLWGPDYPCWWGNRCSA